MEELVELCREDSSRVRIGVVGHRMDRLSDSDFLALEVRISDAMDALQRVISQLNASDGTLQPEVVTSLAEGADRLIARKAVELGVLEIVVLPFHRRRFEHDFDTDESLAEFRELVDAAVSIIEPSGEPPRAEDGYELASSVIIDCSDLMIAVWDGQPGRGAGGTADSVEKALRRGRPVIWIHARQPYAVEVIRPEPDALVPVVARVINQFATAIESAGAFGAARETTLGSTLLN